jgi:hypothetical protein
MQSGGFLFMIAFDLQCGNGHTFEGWFEDNQAYNDQKKKDLIACPVCNDKSVTKILSPFAIKSSDSSTKTGGEEERQLSALAKVSQEVVDFVEKNFDDVGANFTKEALKIHYGVTEPRNIRGVSTKNEEKMMKSEGIEFFKFPLPSPPDQDS